MVHLSPITQRKFAALLFVSGFLLGIAGTSIGASMTGSRIFSDVQPGTYYDDAVGEMYNIGIIKGYESGNFGPNDYVTRGQVAVMMKRLRDQILGISSSSSRSSVRSRRSSSSSSSSSSVNSTSVNGAVRFTTASYSINENGGLATISVIRTGGDVGIVDVTYSLSGATATVEEDYQAITGELTFANGESSGTFTILITDDDASEGDETLTLILSNPTNGLTLSTPSTATLTIRDNDVVASSSSSAGPTAGSFGFSALEYDALENSSGVTITVLRSVSNGAATVQYATSNGTASSTFDYSPASGTLSFGDNDTSKTFTIPLTDSSSIDGKKTVNLTLSNVTGASSLGTPSTALLNIIDDETASFGTGSLKLGSASFSVTENDGFAIISVRRMGGTLGAISVDYATSEGTATPGKDYTETTGTLTFAEGEAKKTFSVPVHPDTFNESEERVNLNIFNPTGGATLGSPSNGTLSIYE